MWPWFADPSPEGQERDRRLVVVPDVELNATNPDLKVQVLQNSERRGCVAGVHLDHGSAGPPGPRQRTGPAVCAVEKLGYIF